MAEKSGEPEGAEKTHQFRAYATAFQNPDFDSGFLDALDGPFACTVDEHLDGKGTFREFTSENWVICKFEKGIAPPKQMDILLGVCKTWCGIDLGEDPEPDEWYMNVAVKLTLLAGSADPSVFVSGERRWQTVSL